MKRFMLLQGLLRMSYGTEGQAKLKLYKAYFHKQEVISKASIDYIIIWRISLNDLI